MGENLHFKKDKWFYSREKQIVSARYDFPTNKQDLLLADIQEFLRKAKNNYPSTGNKDVLWDRLVTHRNCLMEGKLKPSALRQRLSQADSLSNPFRVPVTGMKGQCSTIDVNTGLAHATYPKTHVDHKIELQVIGYAWHTMEGGRQRQTDRQLNELKT